MSHDASSSRLPQPPSLAGGRFDRLLLRLVDLGLAGCIFVVPFLMGGRQALGQLVLVTLAVLAAMAWVLRQCLRAQGVWKRSAGSWLLLAGIALLLVQLSSLPPSLLAGLSPQTAKLLPLWSDGAEANVRLGVWSRISLAPAATRDGLVLFLAYSLLFVTAVQRIRVIEDVERLLRWCAISALLMAAFGLAQYVASNGKFFWVYEHPFSTTADVAKGSFTNRNHFAHFLALGIGPLVWWVQHTLRKPHKHRRGEFADASSYSTVRLGSTLRIIALGIVLFAGLLSLSRGGMLVMLLAVAISATVCYRASSLGLRFLAGLGATALLIGAALMVFGYDQVAGRVDNLASGSIETLDTSSARRTIWEAVGKAIPGYLVLGSGVGTLQQVYPMHVETQNDSLYYTHAENGYLQVALETGMTGLVLAIAGILLCAFWCLAGLRTATSNRILVCVGAVTAGLAANVIHSLFDFVWYVPACMALVALLAACACRLRQLAAGKPADRGPQFAFSRTVGAALAASLAVLGAWMIQGRVGPAVAEQSWFQFVRIDRTSTEFNPPSDAPQPDPEAIALRAREGKARKMVSALEEVVSWDPDHAEAHLRLAETYLVLFECLQKTAVNEIQLRMISDTVMKAGFESPQAMQQWLSVAVGEHVKYLEMALRHARSALNLNPLAGEGYVCLAELCFLEGGGRPTKAAYIEQAVRVRPFHGLVLFEAGLEAFMAGNFEQTLALWPHAFRRGAIYQDQIVEWLAGHIYPERPVDEIQLLLDTFQPDLHGLSAFHHVYSESLKVPEEQLIPLKRLYVRALEEGAGTIRDKKTATLWLEAMQIYSQLGESARAAQCGRTALACDPNDYQIHYQFAECLTSQGSLAEAEEHFRWCLTRRPDNTKLETRLRQIIMARADSEVRVAPGNRMPAPWR